MEHATPDAEPLVSDYVDVWNGDYSKLDVVSESFSFYSPPDEIHGRDAFEAYLRDLNTAFPDATLETGEVLTSDDGTTMTEFGWTGTHEREFDGVPPTGTTVEIAGMATFEIDGGEILEGRTYFDSLEWLTRLGIDGDDTPETDERDAKDVVREYVDAYNAGDAEGIETLLTEDFVVHGLPGIDGDEHGRDVFLDWLHATFEAFPDKHTNIAELIAEGGVVAARWRSTATHEGTFGGVPATNREWTATAQTFVRVDDGKLAEMWFQPDQLGMLQQLGVIDPTGG